MVEQCNLPDNHVESRMGKSANLIWCLGFVVFTFVAINGKHYIKTAWFIGKLFMILIAPHVPRQDMLIDKPKNTWPPVYSFPMQHELLLKHEESRCRFPFLVSVRIPSEISHGNRRSKNHTTWKRWLLLHARCRAISLLFVVVSKSKPRSNKRHTVSRWPCWQAICIGLFPSLSFASVRATIVSSPPHHHVHKQYAMA